ncbi:mitochondrial carrier protein, putative [Bodo saltans]|uniref:Mitochondrial carrier protein, putative n=1 Tax=Bodo saltans TaxID=75058 RepID=A0A0S4JRL2_BODSA|nr:mitochondrial carrier protein, putative [Bodo saltans]|eukprot:CUG92891.1 mitochondrial carrier protein, putative [Bodo saltans]
MEAAKVECSSSSHMSDMARWKRERSLQRNVTEDIPKNNRTSQQRSRGFSSATATPAMLSGAVLAVLFNPYDRALYLRVHHSRSFFHRENWRTPFQGFANAAVYRTVCSGSYLVWQDTGRFALERTTPGILEERPVACGAAVGLFAGTVNGLLLNHPQLIKYRMWTDGSGTFASVTAHVLRTGGMRLLFRGVRVSVARDAVFGVVYEVLRGASNSAEKGSENSEATSSSSSFLRNVCAAATASCCSAPFNYCRNIAYGAPFHSTPLGVQQLLRLLWIQCKQQPTHWERLRLVNARCNLVWGTIRVGLGMGVGQGMFQWFKTHL